MSKHGTICMILVSFCLLAGSAVFSADPGQGPLSPLQQSFSNSQASAWVKADSQVYPAGSQVGIGGGNFNAGETITLQVVHADGSPSTGYSPWTVTSFSDGSFRSSWELPTVETSGEVLQINASGSSSGLYAQSSFMAAPSLNLDQLHNGTMSSSPEWANGNINTTNSCYSEGNSVPFRYFVAGTGAGTQHSFVISMEWTKGGVHAYDYVTEYDQSEAAAIAAAGGPCGSPTTPPGDCATPVGSYPWPDFLLTSNYTGSIPSDFFTTVNPLFVLDGPGDLLFYNATIDSIGKMYFGGTPSDRTLNIPVYFTTTATGSVGIFWGGHLASGTSSSWGAGNGSASVGGAPYHMRVIDFDGGGGANQDRSIQNGSVCLPPAISLSCTPSDTLCEDSTYSCSVASGAGSYLWTVSGGTIASGQGTNSITYTVTASAGGIVTVAVTACNVASGCSTSFCCAVDTVNLAVEVCNLCPVASCPGDTSIYLCSPQQICIPGFSCSDANGNLVSCTAVGGTLTGSDICFTPTTSGVYTLKLIALDGDGCADTCETQVTV
ncbi:MAG: hypothetical protein NDJ18_04300, partial [candidate division Zixibacteria bacterium]|nr:hypothetical protein [candidate division Zixibacteria bacterium]